jgi:hypothetical protein
MIAGSKLGIKYPDELNNEESNKKILKEQFQKYDKQFGKIYNQSTAISSEGVKATVDALKLSHMIPNKGFNEVTNPSVKVNKEFKEILEKKEVNKYRLPTFLF